MARYYSEKVDVHGPTPLGVDWTCEPTQELRFVQLLKLCNFRIRFSLNDVGCGYGALLGFLNKRHRGTGMDYLGFDLSQSMIDQAVGLWRDQSSAQFVACNASPRVADYSVASGIFNVKLDQSTDQWTAFVRSTLADMHANSRKGFAVNFLAPLASGIASRPELYRVDSAQWIDYLDKAIGCRTKLVEGYGLREFTLLVRY